jgi:hypothetical protein
MRAHQLDENNVILNTINVASLDDLPNLIDASLGGQIGDQWNGGTEFASPTPDLGQIKANLAAKVENAVLAIYQKPVTLAREYENRNTQAQAFKDAGYTGTPGSFLKGFADKAGLDYESAADRVLAQAAAFLAAEPVLADLRMEKYAIQLAADQATAQAIFDSAMSQIQATVAQIS